MAFNGLMVSVSGVRGRVGEALTPEVMATYAAAFGAWAVRRHPGRPVVVGRDSRVSGPMFTRVVHAALESVGCHVLDIGMVPTPTVQMAVEHHHAAGGLAITASHNPVEWNALKFIGPSGLFLSADEGADMRALMEAGIPRASWDALGRIEPDTHAIQRHLDAVLALPFLDVAAIRARAFHVALDCCHGAGSMIMPQLLDALGCRVSSIGMTPDGRFPRPPEPVAENLGELGALVRESGAVIGLGHRPGCRPPGARGRERSRDRRGLHAGDGRARGAAGPTGRRGDQPEHQQGRAGRGARRRRTASSSRRWAK